MGSEAHKAVRELEVFTDFVRIGALPFVIDSAEKRTPPEPDIICRHSHNGYVAFELVEICDPNLAEFFANPKDGNGAYIRTSDPSPQIIRKKMRRPYTTPYPIELLCFTDGRVITPADVIIPTILPFLGSFAHVFRKAWLLSEQKVFLVWGEG